MIQTSRNQTWSYACDAIEVNIFDRDESIAPAPRTPITVAPVMLAYWPPAFDLLLPHATPPTGANP